MSVSDSSAPAIEANGLVKRYGKDVLALDHLSFAVMPSTTFGMLGPNGAGKSTTVKVLTTLARPDDGHARVAGRDVRSRAGRGAARDRRGRAARGGRPGRHGPREPAACRAGSTAWVARTCASGSTRCSALRPRRGGRPHGARTYSRRHAAQAPRRDGPHPPAARALPRRADHRPRSRGTGRAVGTRSGGSPTQDGLTILLTTHYLEEADRLADRLAIVDRGRVVAEGTPDAAEGRAARRRHHRRAAPRSDGAGGRIGRWPASPASASRCVDGRTLRAQAEHGASRRSGCSSRALEAAGIAVASVTVSRPSLDDVYLRHTGRSFKQQ